MSDLPLRIGALLAGIALLTLFVRSASRTALVNRHRGDRLANGIAWMIFSTITRLLPSRRSYDAVQDACAWVFPLYIVGLIVSWFALVQIGFALIIWALHVETSLLKAMIASGSALSTLGFLTPTGSGGQFLAILEGAMGLGVVVFFFTFIPGYQSTIQARELQVSWLYARAGVSPTGFTLVEWLKEPGNTSDLTGMWEDWEAWFRLLTETLALAPVLTFVPTHHRGQTWLAAAASVLDSASFCVSTLEGKGLPQAWVCRRVGVEAMRLLALEHDAGNSPGATARPWHSARLAFNTTCARLAALRAPVSADLDASWQRFVTLRREYEGPLSSLARKLLIPTEDSVLRPLPE
jgi:hypothetical protein